MTEFLNMLRCSDGSYYVGSSTNLDLRVEQHRVGLGGDYTARRWPFEVVFTEELATLHDAFPVEREVKGWSRAKKEALIRRDYAALLELSWSTARRAQEHVLRQAQDALNAASTDHTESAKARGYARG